MVSLPFGCGCGPCCWAHLGAGSAIGGGQGATIRDGQGRSGPLSSGCVSQPPVDEQIVIYIYIYYSGFQHLKYGGYSQELINDCWWLVRGFAHGISPWISLLVEGFSWGYGEDISLLVVSSGYQQGFPTYQGSKMITVHELEIPS